jgi:tetratricopeptide (TPR) repeat protein
MKKAILSIVLLTVATLAWAQADYVIQGDQARDKFDNTSALKFYQLAYQADTARCEVIWKVSRTHVDIGEVASEDVQRKNYYEGEKYARKAVLHCPQAPDAHLALAISVGRVALMEGGKKKVSLSKEVKIEAEKTLELDAQNDIAMHVLARWNREVANLSGVLKMFAKILYGGLPPAANDRAIELFKQAIDLKPNYINHHLELGITYQELDEYALAKAEYEKVASLPIAVFNDATHKKEAAERLAEVIKKLD